MAPNKHKGSKRKEEKKDKDQGGGSKRRKEGGGGGGGEAASAASAAAAAAAAAAARAEEQERSLQRSLDVLFIVFERQRQAAREARAARKQEFAHALEATSTLPFSDLWPGTGEDDDDGDDAGATVGGGWRHWGGWRKRSDDRMSAADKQRAARNRPPEDLAFFSTLSAAARTCHAWRDLAFNACDRAMVYQNEPKNVPSSRGPWQCDLASVLRASKGGALRALWVRGSPEWNQLEHVPTLAGALGLLRAQSRRVSHVEEEGLADVVRGLRVLVVSSAEMAQYKLEGLPFARPPPQPPLLSALVTLRVGEFTSTYAPKSPSFFSAANLPSLRTLEVGLSAESNCPLEIAHGGGHSGQDPAFLPPPLLQELHVRQQGIMFRPKPWPKGEPLTVSLESLASLAPTLRKLRAERMWAISGSRTEGGGGGRAPRAARNAVEVMFDYAERSDNAPFPSDLAPMARLAPGLAPLSNLTTLRLSADPDWYRAPAHLPKIDLTDVDKFMEALDVEMARWKEWRLACREVLRPLAQNLRRLEIVDMGVWFMRFDATSLDTPVALPPAISELTALTALRVRCLSLESVGYLERLVGLRRLSLEAHIPKAPEEHPPVLDTQLSALSLLEDLTLSEPARCLAPVIQGGLPHLRKLTLWGGQPCERNEPPPPPPPPLAVLRAALSRMQQHQGEEEGLAVFWVKRARSSTDARQLRLSQLEAIIAARADESDDDDDDEDDGDEDDEDGGGRSAHARLHEAALEELESDRWSWERDDHTQAPAEEGQEAPTSPPEEGQA